MSINGYLMAGRINFIAAIFGVILTGILYWKLDIRKACSMMLLVEEVDQKEFLTGLFHAMYDELPLPKPKKKK